VGHKQVIVPKYWAEAKIKTKIDGKQFTVKRFGWSDIDIEDAQANAEKRTEEALERAKSGQTIRRVDHKVSYNGAEGLPIREEIIRSHNDAVITRNSYGALCLNTPDVLFADIDFEIEPSFKMSFISFTILLFISVIVGLNFDSWGVFFVGVVATILFTSTLSDFLFKLKERKDGKPEERSLRIIHEFSIKNPTWHLRLYRTPMGFRVLVMHKTFNPRSEESIQFLKDVDSDPLYVQMSKNQNCFRARISPKPWRIGVGRLGPRPGVWPINSKHIPGRIEWVKNYNEVSKNFSSCRFVEELGSNEIDPKAEFVRNIHDEYCQAHQALKIA
jgi:hypothetical protein